jgi:hypothetical protein
MRERKEIQELLHEEGGVIMSVNRDTDLARVREARMLISAEFNRDPALLAEPYVQL